jgi:hypothetical protein
MNREQFVNTIEKLGTQRQAQLQKKGAIDFVSGKNFVAWIKALAVNQYQAEVWSWGKEQEPMLSDSVESLKTELFNAFD